MTKPELEARLAAAEAELSSQYITWTAVRNTFNLVRREFISLCEDVFQAGAWTRQQVQPALVYIQSRK